MHLHRDSAAGVRFLAAVREGRGLKPSARAAGVGKETGYRWLREAFGALREQGLSVLEAQAMLGYSSALVLGWDAQRTAGLRDGRHHLAVDASVEDLFWVRFAAGDSLGAARRAAHAIAANPSCGPRPPTKSSPKPSPVKRLQTRDTSSPVFATTCSQRAV